MKKLFYILGFIAVLGFVNMTQVQASDSQTYEKPTLAPSIIDYFGYHDQDFYSGVTWDTYHVASKHRDKVYAPMDATVLKTGENDVLGKYIILKHNDDLQTLFGQLDAISVSEGEHIVQKGIVATVSDAQPLYQEVTYKNTPIDPASIIGFKQDEFMIVYAEAVDEIERGPYSLISDIDFDQWDEVSDASFAQASVTGAANSAASGEQGLACNPGAGTTTIDGEPHYCCEIQALASSDGAKGRYVPNTCNCAVFNRIVNDRIARRDIRRQILRGSRYGEPPSSILDMMCWDQLAAIQGRTGDMYQAPLASSTMEFSEIINESIVPVGKAWRDGVYYPTSSGGLSGGDLLNIPGIAAYSYMQAQEFLDRAVDGVNNLVRDAAGSILNEVTGGIFGGALGISKEYSCDAMFRLWNVAEDCFDIKIPEIPDILDRIQLPGIPCVLESFAYGGSGMRDVRDLVRPYERGAEPYTGLYGLSLRLQRDYRRRQ